jgi:hypothetical protein
LAHATQDGRTDSANTFQGTHRHPLEKPQCQNHEGKNLAQPLTYGPYRDETVCAEMLVSNLHPGLGISETLRLHPGSRRKKSDERYR